MTAPAATPVDADRIRGRVRELLDGLGPDARSVAETLRREGCRGFRYAPSHCPVARHVARELGLQVTACVGQVTAYLPDCGDMVAVMPPPAVNEFIAAFDDLRFPSLVEREGQP